VTGATVYRNMPRTEPVPYGQVPAWTEGRWFVHCPDHGHVGTPMMYGNPVTARAIADRHNANHHD
jgi:hypothetical protein